MLAVLSPSKSLDFESTCPSHRPTQPQFLDDSQELITTLRKKSRPQLQDLMGISENLADLNYTRYKNWTLPFSEDNARAALLAFTGDVYAGFDLKDYSKSDFQFAQKHVLILSGLYGALRPMDLIQPYRLEMGTNLKTDRGKTLYEFWGDRVTKAVATALKSSGNDILVNLASNEYYSALQPEDLNARIITPMFKELKNGSYKFMSYYGKKARGLMCDFMIRNQISEPAELKKFRVEGYRYNAKLSDGDNWVFTRDAPPKKK